MSILSYCMFSVFFVVFFFRKKEPYLSTCLILGHWPSLACNKKDE